MDRTQRILDKLQHMIDSNLFIENPKLDCEIKELIAKVNAGEVNLYDYRRASARDRYGSEIVEVIAEEAR